MHWIIKDVQSTVYPPFGPMMRTLNSPAPAPVVSTQKWERKSFIRPGPSSPGPHTFTSPSVMLALMSIAYGLPAGVHTKHTREYELEC